MKRLVPLILFLLVIMPAFAGSLEYLHGQVGRYGQTGGGGLEINGAIDRDVRLGETLAAGDIVEVTGKVYAAGQPVKTENPYTAPAGVAKYSGGVFGMSCAAMSADGAYLAVAHTSTPYLTTYRWNSDQVRYLIATAPSDAPGGEGQAVAMSADGQYLVYTKSASPYLLSYRWNATNGRYEKTANPDTPPTGADGSNWSVAVSDDGSYLVVSQYFNAPGMLSYKWSAGNNRYEKTANPDVNVPLYCRSVEISADGQRAAAVSYDPPVLRSYRWNEANGRYEKTANPNTEPALQAVSLAMSANGDFVAVGLHGVPAITGYTWNVDNNRYQIASASSGTPTGNVNDIAMSRDGLYLVAGHFGSTGASPYLTTFAWNATATRYEVASAPNQAPSGSVAGVAMSHNGAFIAAAHGGTSAPAYLITYGTDISHTLKAYKSESGLLSIPVDLMYFGVLKTGGDEDDIASASMFFWKDDPLEEMDP